MSSELVCETRSLRKWCVCNPPPELSFVDWSNPSDLICTPADGWQMCPVFEFGSAHWSIDIAILLSLPIIFAVWDKFVLLKCVHYLRINFSVYNQSVIYFLVIFQTWDSVVISRGTKWGKTIMMDIVPLFIIPLIWYQSSYLI